MQCGNYCGKSGSDQWACVKCKTSYCSARCQKQAVQFHAEICAEMVQANAEIRADIRHTNKPSEDSAKALLNEVDKEEQKKAKKKKKAKAPQEEPQQIEPAQEEYFIKPYSSQQVHEARIYSILASKIDKYRDFHQELPGKEGLRLVKLDEFRPQGENIESSYRKVVELLREIHEAGVVCSDLKPEHIRQRKDGELMIIDFNFSYVVSDDLPQKDGWTLRWASVDQLARQNCDIVDDLEAACRIAKHWATPNTEDFKHQREVLRAGVARLASLLSPTTDWLDDHLRYVVSLPRQGASAEIYDKLALGKKFTFSVDDFAKDFQSRNTKCTLRVAPSGAGNLGNVKGELVEQIVRANMQSMFPNYTLDMAHFHFRQTFSDEKRDVTEWDFVLARHQGQLPKPLNYLVDPYPHVPGGLHLVGEVWTNFKPVTKLRTKFSVLFEGHRPIHTLHYFGNLLLVAGGSVTYEDQPLAMEGDTLLAYGLRDDLDLCVLVAAGRISYFPLNEFPMGKTIDLSSETVFGLRRENTNLKDENTNLKDKYTNLKDENTDLKDKYTHLKDKYTNLETRMTALEALLTSAGLALPPQKK